MDVKYDIPMCQSHSTRPQPIQPIPMQKKLFSSSFQAKFPKIHKIYCYNLIVDVTVNFLFPQSFPLAGAYLGKNVKKFESSNTQQKRSKTDPYEPKMAKKRTAENFGTTNLDSKFKK